LKRLGLVAAGVALAIAGLIAVALALSARDEPELSGAARGPGELQADRGAGHDAAARVPEGEWPTSGPHRPDLVTAERRRLSDDQIIHALELGNVVILYDAPDPGAALERLQEEVAGPFDAELAAAGQAVILARRPGAGAATALAWRRVLWADDPADPALREFAEAWLGRGL
jgi:Protein of unknown function (DUF3105)